jgi:hypothetical protein
MINQMIKEPPTPGHQSEFKLHRLMQCHHCEYHKRAGIQRATCSTSGIQQCSLITSPYESFHSPLTVLIHNFSLDLEHPIDDDLKSHLGLSTSATRMSRICVSRKLNAFRLWELQGSLEIATNLLKSLLAIS